MGVDPSPGEQAFADAGGVTLPSGSGIERPGSIVGRVALVPGGSSGIGFAIAQRLSHAGIVVGLVARRLDGLKRAVAQIESMGGRAVAFDCDISSEAEVFGSLVPRVKEVLGDPQILVNAAGTFSPVSLFLESDPSEWMRTVDVNLGGSYLTCRAFVPAMVKGGWGRVINITSSSSVVAPMPMTSAYSTSKAGVNLMTRALARELEHTGVTANVLHPGDVQTDMVSSIAASVASSGPEAEPLRDFVAWVDRTGGDPPEKAAEVVMSVVCDSGEINGRFLWIPDSLWGEVPTW